MDEYRAKCVTFQAVQWFLGKNIDGVVRHCSTFMINTGSGVLRVEQGDYVVRGPLGSKMVFKAPVFEAIFERVDSGDK